MANDTSLLDLIGLGDLQVSGSLITGSGLLEVSDIPDVEATGARVSSVT